jgi:hypothetical protein
MRTVYFWFEPFGKTALVRVAAAIVWLRRCRGPCHRAAFHGILWLEELCRRPGGMHRQLRRPAGRSNKQTDQRTGREGARVRDDVAARPGRHGLRRSGNRGRQRVSGVPAMIIQRMVFRGYPRSHHVGGPSEFNWKVTGRPGLQLAQYSPNEFFCQSTPVLARRTHGHFANVADFIGSGLDRQKYSRTSRDLANMPHRRGRHREAASRIVRGVSDANRIRRDRERRAAGGTTRRGHATGATVRFRAGRGRRRRIRPITRPPPVRTMLSAPDSGFGNIISFSE